VHKRVHVHVRPARSIFSNLPIVAESVTQFYVRPAPSNFSKALNSAAPQSRALRAAVAEDSGGAGSGSLWLSREGYATASPAPCSNL
jgi:hypothetical protein